MTTNDFYDGVRSFMVYKVGQLRMELNATGMDVPIPIDSSILLLHGWRVTAITETPTAYRVEAEYAGLVNCPACGVEDRQRFGVRYPEFQDKPVHAKRVTIIATRQRYRCAACHRVYTTPAPQMHDRHKMTECPYCAHRFPTEEYSYPSSPEKEGNR